jgi:serine/threonine protein kinase
MSTAVSTGTKRTLEDVSEPTANLRATKRTAFRLTASKIELSCNRIIDSIQQTINEVREGSLRTEDASQTIYQVHTLALEHLVKFKERAEEDIISLTNKKIRSITKIVNLAAITLARNIFINLHRPIKSAYSKCYKAIDDRDNELVVKVNFSALDVFQAAQREIAILTTVKATHIVKLVDCFAIGELCFGIVMPRLAYSLGDHFKIYSLEELRNIGRQILEGLIQLHSAGYNHNDLKPDNIMIAGDIVYLIDFGLTLPIGTAPEFQVQTACYRAPEVALGSSPSHKSDMWSFGAILLKMLLGRVVFDCRYDDNSLVLHVITKALKKRIPKAMAEGSCWKDLLFRPGYHSLKPCLYPEELSMTRPFNSSLRGDDKTSFRDLLNGLLEYNPTHRFSAEEALKHPFFSVA